MRLIFLPVLSLVLIGCNRSNKGKWILESYDSNKGYVFVKDGVRYEAHCSGFTYADKDNQYRLGNLATHEWECSQVLAYIHKPVPTVQTLGLQASGLVIQDDKDKWQSTFYISAAK